MSVQKFLSPLSSLRGVGPALSKALEKLIGQNKIFDLLLHKPIAMEKILFCPRLFEVKNDELIIVKLKVESHIKPANPRQPFKIICYNPTGYVNLVFFRIFPGQIAKMPIGSEIAVLGHLEKSSGENQIIHPQEILPAALIDKLPKVNVIYPLAAAITQKFLTAKIKEVLVKFNNIDDEWIDQNLLKQQAWPSFTEALKNLHNPQSADDFLLPTPSRKRLSYDELLAWQIATLTAKETAKENKNFTKLDNNLAEKFLSSLPFKLTNAQLEVMNKIKEEIYSHKKMLRLLQGDVGSGKTVIAIFTCLLNASQKKQSCVIVPTTILAKQHFSYFTKFLRTCLKSRCDEVDSIVGENCSGGVSKHTLSSGSAANYAKHPSQLEDFKQVLQLGLQIEILTSATTKKQKIKIRENLLAGKIDILISTHACLEDEVKFKNLGLAIIDEQHRFGVMQRLKLVEKGRDVDVLLMSATPIPRSLMMGLYGDMDISTLREKPKNRQKIETLIMSSTKTDELHEAIKRALSRGEKIYWICPAIEEKNEELTISNYRFDNNDNVGVKKKYGELVKIFDEKNVALLHGKMKENEKEKIMAEFSKVDGSLKILVATTVIEVGIDVSDATIIIIENAEHFGLAQLHQLRGRVGRSEKKSFCILLYGKKFGINARKRLNILRESDDGFFIAEEDLKMRGSGELLGTKQSGFPEFKIADLNFDADLLKIAHKQAELILHHDQKLKKPQSLKYQDLLRLFSYDDCLKMISGG